MNHGHINITHQKRHMKNTHGNWKVLAWRVGGGVLVVWVPDAGVAQFDYGNLGVCVLYYCPNLKNLAFGMWFRLEGSFWAPLLYNNSKSNGKLFHLPEYLNPVTVTVTPTLCILD